MGAARSDVLLFKINRENEERSPKFELVDYHPYDPQQNPLRRPPRPVWETAFLPPHDGVFLDSVVLGPDHRKRLFFPDQVTTEIVKGKKILLETYEFEFQMKSNFSRQRSWRDYVTNPKSVVPMIQESEKEISPLEKRVVDFWNFSGGKQQVVWSFDFTQREEDNYCETEAKFLDENNWLFFVRSPFFAPPAKVYHSDLKTKTVTLYVFPRLEDPSWRYYGIYEDLIYYSTWAEYQEEEDDGIRNFYVLGHFMKKSRRRRFDSDLIGKNCFNNLCFLEIQKQEDIEIDLKIGNNGFVHLISYSLGRSESEDDVFTFTIEDVKQRIPKAQKRAIKINDQDDEETNLPTINLGEKDVLLSKCLNKI